MATIQSLHDLVSQNETQHDPSDRITGGEIREVDNAIIDELALRGVVQRALLNDLSTVSHTESSIVIIPGEGTFYIVQSAEVPDNINSFASLDAGWIWKRLVPKPSFLDTSFLEALGTSADAAGEKVRMQSAGKIVIAGSFANFNGVAANKLVRLNPNGSNAGLAMGTGVNNAITALAIHSDDKIVIGGSFTTFNGSPAMRVARLNADGSPDTAFNANMATGFSGGSGFVYALLVQPDGKILVGGEFADVKGMAIFSIGRLNADGTADTTFNTNLGTGVNFNGGVYAMALQADGKIILAGNFSTFNGTSVNRLIRLNANGTVDTAFVTASGTQLNQTPFYVAIQADQKILIGGNFTTYNAITANRIVRLNADGTLDTAFQNIVAGGFNAGVQAIAVQADGKIVCTGSFATFNNMTAPGIARLNPAGSLDLAFSAAAGTGSSVGQRDMVLQADGKIVCTGSFTSFAGNVKAKYILRINSTFN